MTGDILGYLGHIDAKYLKLVVKLQSAKDVM